MLQLQFTIAIHRSYHIFKLYVAIIFITCMLLGSNLINHGDYRKQNYSYSFKDKHDEFKLTLYPVDDDLVESDEYYYLNITLLGEPDEIDRIILSNYQVKVTIFNDDGKLLLYLFVGRLGIVKSHHE